MRKLWVSLGIAALILTATPVRAGDPPPNAIFKSGDSKQKGWVGSYCWDGVCADKVPSVPENAEKAKSTAKARIRIKHRVKPSGFSLEAYRELDEYGRPTGESETLPTKLRPHEKRGKVVAWDARFTLPEAPGHVYLFAAAAWPHDPDRPEGDVYWTFHLRLVV